MAFERIGFAQLPKYIRTKRDERKAEAVRITAGASSNGEETYIITYFNLEKERWIYKRGIGYQAGMWQCQLIS